jgi:hypothetical protein
MSLEVILLDGFLTIGVCVGETTPSTDDHGGDGWFIRQLLHL